MEPLAELIRYVNLVRRMRRDQIRYATRQAGTTLAQVRQVEREVDYMTLHIMEAPIPVVINDDAEQLPGGQGEETQPTGEVTEVRRELVDLLEGLPPVPPLVADAPTMDFAGDGLPPVPPLVADAPTMDFAGERLRRGKSGRRNQS